MLTAYRRVFAHPGALAFSATGLVARLPISMVTLGIVLLVSALTGSYGLAGAVSAAFTLGNAAFAVPHGRLADRLGQAVVLYADALVFALATGLVVVSVREGWALPWPHLLAALAGAAMPQAGTMVRARWAHLLDDEAERHTAFAVEGVVDEVVFVTGPALVTFLSTLHSPSSGLLVAIAFGTVGAVLLAGQRRTEPPVVPPDPETGRAPMPWAFLLPVTACAVALGALFGSQEVAAVAFADDEGRRAASGVVLGVFAFGSLLSGAATGATTHRRGPLPRLRVGLVLLALGALTLPLLPGLLLVGVAMFVTGMALAPTLIAMFSLIEACTPRARLNESMGVVQTGVGAGIAPGAWLAGVVADGSGGSAAFWVGAVAAAAAGAAALLVPDRRR